MHPIESITIGIREIIAHRTRSVLTMLGVIFGVAAVIATVAIGAGAEEETLREISLLGTSNVRIRRKSLDGLQEALAARRAPFGLTQSDVASIREICAEMVQADGVARKFSATVSRSGQTPSVALLGVTPGYSEAIDFQVAKGRFLTRFDIEGQKQVCVLGAEVADILFPLASPLGQKIQINSRDYIVVGVMQRKAAASGGGVLDVGDLNLYVMAPVTTGIVLLEDDRRNERLDEIVVKVHEGADLKEAADLMGRILDRRHGGVGDYEIVIPEHLLERKQRIQRIFGYTLIAIAGISLLVGGIGIMNIMLSTVTQRTREIGIRRAIGATRRDVLSQFLIESLVLSIAGGLLGVGVGFGLARLIAYYTQWNMPISVPAIVVSFSVSAMTGLIFGLYPAMKAAQLDPIEALRHE
jgi:putative ABC transport system permease protein